MTAAVLAIPALFLPGWFGFQLCRLLWPAGLSGRPAVALQATLGTGFGLGLASVIYFAALTTGSAPGATYAWVEGGAFALGGRFLYGRLRARRLRAAPAAVPAPAAPAPPRFVQVAVAIGVVCLLASFPLYYSMFPHGVNDSYYFWNLRARFFVRDAEHWRNAFYPTYMNPDYPLLLPATVARCWLPAGEESPFVPALVGLTFAVATIVALASAVTLFRGPTQGALAAVVVLGTAYFMETVTMQVADVPVALFYLGCPVALCVRDRAGGGWGLVALAGALAGFAAWTKNDGQLFVLAVVLVRFFRAAVRRSWREYRGEAGAFAVGLAVGLIGLAAFKFGVAPPAAFVAGQGPEATLARVTNPDRYLTILEAYATDLLDLGPGLIPLLALYAVLLGPGPAERRSDARPLFALVALMLLGYAAVYLVTPLDLEWQLEASFDRLRMQLWPLALFALFLWVATPAESLAKASPAGGAVPDAAPDGRPRDRSTSDSL
jgi:hypothetical protein